MLLIPNYFYFLLLSERSSGLIVESIALIEQFHGVIFIERTVVSNCEMELLPQIG